MEKPNKLEEGQIWIYYCSIDEKDVEEHIVTKYEAVEERFVCEDGCSQDIELLLNENNGWRFGGYANNKNIEMDDEKIVSLTRRDKVFLLNGRIAHFSLSKLVEMTDAEVDEEFEKLQTVTNSQFEGFKAVARVLVNSGIWESVDLNVIESELNIKDV